MPLNNANVGMPTSSIMTGLLTQRKRAEYTKNTSQLFVKPTEEGQFYRLRLLNFSPDQKFVTSSNFSHYRDFPFIIQHVHQVWTDIPTDDPSKPKRVCHTIVCPQTDYVKANSTLTKASCPMCSAYGSAWKAWNESHYKNIEAKNRMKVLHNTQRVLVPVYVVNDPNYESNNGSVKVLSLDDDAYKALLHQINAAQENNTPIWNVDACNLYFTWGKFNKTVNEGKPNEYTFPKNGFTRIGFTTTPKHLDALTDDLVDSLCFDANWYTVPTKEELEQFYLENCSTQKQSNDDIPMDIPVAPTPKVASAPKSAPAPKPVKKSAPVVDEPIAQDVTEDVDNIPPPTPSKPSKKSEPAPSLDDNNKMLDDILASIL